MKCTFYLAGLLVSAALGLSSCGETAQANPQSATLSATEKTMPPGVDANYLMGKFDQMKDPRFDTVAMQYTSKPLMMLRKEAYEAFKKMHAAAKKDGVTLTIISSTRNFQQQKAIWEAKWSKTAGQAPESLQRAKVILQYSAMPGASRHHWGTDIDLNGLNNADFNQGGKFEKTYQWLVQHAHAYGYCQPYTAGRNRGYNEERWHWTYMPLSSELTRQYTENITDKDLTGFKGSETAVTIGIVENYVKGINANCNQ